MSAAKAITVGGRAFPAVYLTCPTCNQRKAAHAFTPITDDPEQLSEYAERDPSKWRRDDVCRACRGDEKRAANRDRVKAAQSADPRAHRELKALAPIEKHDRAPAVDPTPAPPAPAQETVLLDDWLASETPGAWRYNTLLIVRDPHYPGSYWLYARPAGFAPGSQVPGGLVSYLAHLLGRVAFSEAMKGFAYA